MAFETLSSRSNRSDATGIVDSGRGRLPVRHLVLQRRSSCDVRKSRGGHLPVGVSAVPNGIALRSPMHGCHCSTLETSS